MGFKAKLWLNLRTSSSLWGDYMKAKYLENQHPIKTQWSSSNSQNWKVICEVKSVVEQHIYWKVGRGDVDFWFDKWSALGPLHLLYPNNEGHISIKLIIVLTSNGEWNWNSLQVELPNDLKNNIINLGIILNDLTNDKSYLGKHQFWPLHSPLWLGYY